MLAGRRPVRGGTDHGGDRRRAGLRAEHRVEAATNRGGGVAGTGPAAPTRSGPGRNQSAAGRGTPLVRGRRQARHLRDSRLGPMGPGHQGRGRSSRAGVGRRPGTELAAASSCGGRPSRPDQAGGPPPPTRTGRQPYWAAGWSHNGGPTAPADFSRHGRRRSPPPVSHLPWRSGRLPAVQPTRRRRSSRLSTLRERRCNNSRSSTVSPSPGYAPWSSPAAQGSCQLPGCRPNGCWRFRAGEHPCHRSPP